MVARRVVGWAFAAAVVATSIGLGHAFVPGTGPARVMLPANFTEDFRLYDIVDKPDRKRARFMYIDPRAARLARAGEPFPDGTVIIMQDRAVELGADGNPILDATGRLRPTARVLGVFVMEKRAGWGAAIPESVRNGDWDYAAYTPDGRPNPQVTSTQACFACHLPQAAADYTFTTAAAVRRDFR